MFHSKSQKIRKIVIHGFCDSRKWWNIKTRSNSIHVNFEHSANVLIHSEVLLFQIFLIAASNFHPFLDIFAEISSFRPELVDSRPTTTCKWLHKLIWCAYVLLIHHPHSVKLICNRVDWQERWSVKEMTSTSTQLAFLQSV